MQTMLKKEAHAGGAEAAASEASALARPVVTRPHLLVMGVDKPCSHVMLGTMED
jgi:hypothetical protein